MNHTQTQEEAQRQAKPIVPKAKELISRSKSIILATVDADGIPNSSYAPFVEIDQQFFILVSFMAKHTRNLSEGKKASIMFIEDESATKQIYARERLTIEAVTTQITRDSEKWNEVINLLKDTHGKVVEVIAEMKDFILISLNPVKGTYVNGFGSAYFVDEKLETMQQRNETDHQSK